MGGGEDRVGGCGVVDGGNRRGGAIPYSVVVAGDGEEGVGGDGEALMSRCFGRIKELHSLFLHDVKTPLQLSHVQIVGAYSIERELADGCHLQDVNRRIRSESPELSHQSL